MPTPGQDDWIAIGLRELEQRKANLNRLLSLQAEIIKLEGSALSGARLREAATIICGIVCEHCHISPALLVPRRQNADAVLARQLVFTLLRDCAGGSLGAIGRCFNRNPTTVAEAIAALRNRLQTNLKFRKQYAALHAASLSAIGDRSSAIPRVS